jgi:hypothetical protein
MILKDSIIWYENTYAETAFANLLFADNASLRFGLTDYREPGLNYVPGRPTNGGNNRN